MFTNHVKRKPLGNIDVNIIEELWKDSIDMHIHPGPDPSGTRPLDGAQIAQYARDCQMKAIVLKSFTRSTAAEAYIIQKNLTPELHVIGSVTISYSATGGLSYAAKVIEESAKMGAKVVWFPAMDAKNCQSYFGNPGGIEVLDENGSLKKEVYEILKVIKDYNLVVCSGHMSFKETNAVFDAAIDLGITKMVATHVLAELSQFSMEEIRSLAAKGVYIEHVYGTLMPRLGNMDPSLYVDCIKEIGAEHTILGTDLCQVWDPKPADGMRHFIAMLLQFGCTPEEVKLMAQTNSAKLLDLV